MPETHETNETGGAGRAMPYEPSAPCASCARGVDPLRAACMSLTDSSVHYFCTRRCREAYLQKEARHAGPALEPSPRARVVAPTSQRTSATLQPVARRIAPSRPTTPRWPLVAGAAAFLIALVPVQGAIQVSALGLSVVAALFASRAVRVKTQAGSLSWLLPPIAVALLSSCTLPGVALAARLGPSPAVLPLLAALLCIGSMWLREHALERVSAHEIARKNELSARLSSRVRVSTMPPAEHSGTHESWDSGEPASDRALASLRIGDEVVVESGSVVPVDGVVVSGFAEMLPYPDARLAVERRRGQHVLAGALLTQGALRVRASQVGDQRALFRVFSHEHESQPASSASLLLARRAQGLQLGLLAVAGMLLVTLLSPQALAGKLAGLAAALLALPGLALTQGIRAAYRRAVLKGSARGVHYREPSSLDRAGDLDTAVLRVEGTLISRRYTLVEVCPLSDTHQTEELVALALAASQAADTHGIAEAVRDFAEPLGIEPVTLRRLSYARGRGVSGLTDGQGTLVFGSRAALLAAGVSVAVADREAQRAELLGQRVVFLALGGRARGLFVFAQAVRAEARLALQTLFDLGLEVELVSGDHRTTVEALARTLDIQQLKAELTADQRAAEVRRLRDGEAQVVAIGRMPEDLALLAAADLSLCLDAAGQGGEHDVVHDVTTASPDLRDAAIALSLARQLRRDIRRVTLAGGSAGLLAVAAALGALPPWLTVLGALTIDWLCLSEAAASLFARARSRSLHANDIQKMPARAAGQPESK